MTNNDYARKINNIMDKAKEDVRTQIDRAYQQGYADAKSELGQNAIDLAHEESDRAYQQGLEDAWEAARKIILAEGLSLHELMQIFGTASSDKILMETTISEVIVKIKEYEQDTIQIGDEVQSCDTRYIVVRIRDNGTFEAISACGTDEGLDLSKFHKTGRHFPQIAEVLAEMRGESE